MVMEMSKNKPNCHDLIPGLPSELATECLIRVPYQFQSEMKSVCRSWRNLLSDSSFLKERRRCGKAELLLCLVQPLSPPILATKAVDETLLLVEESEIKLDQQPRVFNTPRFGLTVYNATMSTWNRVAFPETQIPLFCECVMIQDAAKILLIGGWDPETLQPVRDVYVLDLTGERKWRRGASMKESRSFFACGSVGKTKVYVAGGHDDQKNALKSAEVYDVEKDEWFTVAPMIEGRDECQGFATDLGFCVVSGYGTESQGRFRPDGETYDPVTNSWSRIDNIWLFPEISPRGRIVGGRFSKLWCFTDDELQSRSEIEDESRKCKLELETVKIPVTGSSVFAGSLGGEAVVMVCGRRECEGEGVMMKMTTKTGKWRNVQVPYGFSTLPFSHASIYV